MQVATVELLLFHRLMLPLEQLVSPSLVHSLTPSQPLWQPSLVVHLSCNRAVHYHALDRFYTVNIVSHLHLVIPCFAFFVVVGFAFDWLHSFFSVSSMDIRCIFISVCLCIFLLAWLAALRDRVAARGSFGWTRASQRSLLLLPTVQIQAEPDFKHEDQQRQCIKAWHSCLPTCNPVYAKDMRIAEYSGRWAFR